MKISEAKRAIILLLLHSNFKRKETRINKDSVNKIFLLVFIKAPSMVFTYVVR